MKITELTTNFFSKTVKPSLSDKIILRNKINLSENDKIIKNEQKTAEVPNNCFQTLLS